MILHEGSNHTRRGGVSYWAHCVAFYDFWERENSLEKKLRCRKARNVSVSAESLRACTLPIPVRSPFSPSHTLPSSLESFPSPKNRKNDRQPTSTGSVNMGGKQPTTTWRSRADLVTLGCVLHSWFLAAIQLLRAQSHPSCVCTAMNHRLDCG